MSISTSRNAPDGDAADIMNEVHSLNRLTILCHNTFWFQGVPFPGDNPPEPDREILKRLCAIYRKNKPDVICLQEIQSRETFERMSDSLGMEGSYCPGREHSQYGGAVLWKPGIGRMIRNSLESSEMAQRMWQIVEMKVERHLWRICNIHLPSSRQLGADRAAEQRIAEIQESIRSCHVKPDIIAGDFNEYPNGPLNKYLEADGYNDAALLCGKPRIPTNIHGKRGDYFWIKKTMRHTLLTYAVADKQELAFGHRGKEYLSDHLPLWITVGE